MDLSEFRADGDAPKKKGKAAWSWSPLAPAFSGGILAFDQTLSNCGWFFVVVKSRIIALLSSGMISPIASSGVKGHAESLEKGELIFMGALDLMRKIKPDLVVHESPPIAGGSPGSRSRMMRPESSLLAAQSIRDAAIVVSVPVRMISGQVAKNRFTGNRNADKKDMHAVLYREFAMLNGMKPNNDNTRDALALACVASEEE